MSDPIPFNAVERKERAQESQELLENKVFTAAILALRKRYFEQLMSVDDNEARLRVVEKIRALEDIPQQLTIFVNDEKMAQAKKK